MRTILLTIFVIPTFLTTAQEPVFPTAEIVPASFADVLAEPVPETTQVSRKTIEGELEGIASGGLSDTQKSECEARLNRAIGWLQSIEEEANRIELFDTQTKSVPDAVAKTKAALAVQPTPPRAVIPGETTVVQLESRLTEIRQKAEALEAEHAAKKKESESRATRLQEAAKELLEVQKRITQAKEKLAAEPPNEFEERSKWFEQTTRLSALTKQTERLRAERRYLEAAAELIPLKRDLAEKEWKHQQKVLAAWQAAVESWRKEESKRQAEVARRNAENSHPALRALAEQNAAIAELRAVTANGIASIGKTVKRLKEASKSLDNEFDDLRQKVAYAGTTSSTGVLLRKKRSELPTSLEFLDRDAFVKSEMPKAHLQLMEWKKLHRELSDPAETAERMLGQLDELTDQFGRPQVLKVVTSLFTARKELLDVAIPDQETYLHELNDLDLSNQTLQAEVKEFRAYLDQRVLWMRSDDILTVNDLSQAARGMVALIAPERWVIVARVGFGDLLRSPEIGVGVLALFVLIMMFRARMLNLQERLSSPPAEGETASFSQYLVSFAITLLIAVRWPIILFAVGYRLKLAAGSTAWTQAVGSAVLTTVIFVWGCELLREVVRPKGVGENLFRWSKEATKSIRNSLKMAFLFGTPLVALLQLSQFEELAELESLHRVLFIITITLSAIQIGLVLRPQGQLMRSLGEQSSAAMVYRFRNAICTGITAAPAGFAILSLLGYHYSAYQLSGRLAETGAAMVAMVFVYSLALCWLQVKGYNRALKTRLESQPNTDAEPLGVSAQPAQENVSAEAEPADSISLTDSADHEFRYLLRYASIMAIICGGWFIWSDVLPALHVLDRVELWHNVESIAETVTGTDGTESIVMTDRPVPITLTDVLKALLVCFGTVLIGRRLPGFLELTVLDRLPMDQGGQQAIAILVRYAATLAGMLVACHIIHLSWSSVQWLAAAMTVGLGFGLQEIFANLVSGIIILFERPIRMGDLVTVGDITGNVSKMRMRATTITDFDRRELIVPNKKFITDNVINWTLSDPISRVVLPVGVAYGTNIPLVEKTLLRIARSSPFVMKDPGPTTLFKGFGDSTLDVELRVFLPTRDYYVDVVNELNGAIAREFEKANIEIAFPQRDLHIKSFETAQALVPTEQKNTAA